MSGGQDFWARRRAGVAAEAEAERAAIEAQEVEDEYAALADMDEAEALAALNLPDPDTLTQGDDFSVFMAKAVPDQIRRRALRTLWRSNPVLANVDMLVDYGEDFTDAAMAVENIQTAYQVGKGMLKHIEEMARQAEERANPPAPQEVQDEEEIEDALMAAAQDEAQAETPTDEPEPFEAEQEDVAFVTASPRRMTFRIEETA